MLLFTGCSWVDVCHCRWRNHHFSIFEPVQQLSIFTKCWPFVGADLHSGNLTARWLENGFSLDWVDIFPIRKWGDAIPAHRYVHVIVSFNPGRVWPVIFDKKPRRFLGFLPRAVSGKTIAFCSVVLEGDHVVDFWWIWGGGKGNGWIPERPET